MIDAKTFFKFTILVNCLWFVVANALTKEEFVAPDEFEERHNTNDSLNAPRIMVESRVQANLPLFDIRVDELPSSCAIRSIPVNCAQATECTRRSGYYLVKFPQLGNEISIVECDAYTDGGDWMVVQRRIDGSVDFFLNWTDYKIGFGNINGEYFIGLDKLYALTNFNGPQELYIFMEDADLKTAYAKYDLFLIGNESEKYPLKSIGRYSGTAGESLEYNLGNMFSTKDQNNDIYNTKCAIDRVGAWWYRSCTYSNLNGLYGGSSTTRQGVHWYSLKGYESLKTVKMMIRRRRY